MKLFRTLLLLLLLPSALNAQNIFSTTKIGTGIPIGGSSREDGLAAASTTAMNAYGFPAPKTGTIDQICVVSKSKTGTVGSTDGVIAIYSESAGLPNSSLSSGTFNPGTNGLNCSTQSQAVTIGTQYYFRTANANGTPASNNFAIWQGPENMVQGGDIGGITSAYGHGLNSLRSTNNGSSWDGGAGPRSSSAAYRVHYSSGEYYGYPATNDDTPSNPLDSADRVYSTREVGNVYTTAANAKPIVCGVGMRVNKIGTPTGKIRYRIYKGTALVDSTIDSASTVGAHLSNSAFVLPFASPVTMDAATSYRVVLAEATQSDTSSNAYGAHRLDWDSNAASLALKPFNGTLSKTVCTSSCDGGSWTDTTTSFFFFDLYLCNGNEYASAGGGGVIGAPVNMNGGMQ